jgi:hypothetical protein
MKYALIQVQTDQGKMLINPNHVVSVQDMTEDLALLTLSTGTAIEIKEGSLNFLGRVDTNQVEAGPFDAFAELDA